ncbi:hypothetical protein NRB_15780 [Novosphingobium sp. 11B]
MADNDAEVAEKFLKYDYAETKDLLKTFITLTSASLVLSLTFSEKVIVFSKAPAATQLILFWSWGLFVAALIFAGIGMCFIAAAAGKILYGQIPLLKLSYYRLAIISWAFVLLAGGSFVGALIAMTVSVARTIAAG